MYHRFHKINRFYKFIPLVWLMVSACSSPRSMMEPKGRIVPSDSILQRAESIAAQTISKDIFADTALRQLITTALQNNPDVFIAVERINMSRAQFRVRKGALLPVIAADATASGQKYGDYTMEGVGNYDTNLSGNIEDNQKIAQPFVPYYFAGLRSSWELDLWGKLRALKKSAAFRLLASEQGRRLVTTTLVSEVATSYYDLLALDAMKAVAQKNIRIQDSALAMTLIQKEAGRTTELGVQQMQAQLLRTKSLLATAEQRIVNTENRINQLLGRLPQAVPRAAKLPDPRNDELLSPPSVSVILAQRPDIMEAEWQLKASGADLYAAKASLLPGLTLSPFAGFSSFNSNLFFSTGSLAYGVVGNLSAPLLNRSNLKGNIRRAQAEQMTALHTYNKTVLEACRELSSITNDLEKLKRVRQYSREESEVLAGAVVTSAELFKVGYASYIEVLSAQRQAVEAEINFIEATKSYLQGRVHLYRASGGGW